jgi:hypothetical protein
MKTGMILQRLEDGLHNLKLIPQWTLNEWPNLNTKLRKGISEDDHD